MGHHSFTKKNFMGHHSFCENIMGHYSLLRINYGVSLKTGKLKNVTHPLSRSINDCSLINLEQSIYLFHGARCHGCAMHCHLFIELLFDAILVSGTIKFISRNGGHVLFHFQILTGYGSPVNANCSWKWWTDTQNISPRDKCVRVCKTQNSCCCCDTATESYVYVRECSLCTVSERV